MAPSSAPSWPPPSSCPGRLQPPSPAPASRIRSRLTAEKTARSLDKPHPQTPPSPSGHRRRRRRNHRPHQHLPGQPPGHAPPPSRALPTVAPDHLIIDALRIDHPCPQTKLFYGDALSLSIAAASVVAKVHRDALMRSLDAVHPQYGLASHKGYATPEHRIALKQHGPCPLHRFSFAPIRAVDPNSAERANLNLELALDSGEILFDDHELEDAAIFEDIAAAPEEAAWA